VGSTDEAPSVARPHAAAPLVWRASYAVFALATTVFSLSRMRWAWPDAAWQTNLLDIEAVDHVLNNGLGGAMGISVGGEHALTGYRWFQYFNAAVFGLDTHVELFAYFGLTLTLALAIGGRIFRDLDRRSSGWPARVLVFAIPVVLSTLVGAGSRGMKIGQFFGMTLFVVLALLIDSRMSTRAFLVVVLCTVPPAAVLVLGSYLGAPTIALVLVSLLQRLRPTVERPARPKLYVLTGTFLVSTVGWLLLMSLLGPSELNTGFGELVRQISHDSSFIPKYFLGGAAGSVISAQTLEVSGHGPRFAYAVGALVVLFAVACVVLAYRRAWRGSTVPLLLVLMPVCLVGTLLVGRSMDALWMLAPWYGFNLRLFLVGAIWLLVRALAAVGVPGCPSSPMSTSGAASQPNGPTSRTSSGPCSSPRSWSSARTGTPSSSCRSRSPGGLSSCSARTASACTATPRRSWRPWGTPGRTTRRRLPSPTSPCTGCSTAPGQDPRSRSSSSTRRAPS